MAASRIGLREVRALQPGETAWDGAVAGFHARRQKSEAVSYVVVYRTAEGRQRWHTIGRHEARRITAMHLTDLIALVAALGTFLTGIAAVVSALGHANPKVRL